MARTPVLPDATPVGPPTCPLATFAVAICNVSFTSICDVQSSATNFRFGSIWHVHQAVGEWPVFALTGRLEWTFCGRDRDRQRR